MADVHSKEIRSYNMSRIRSRNTKPELLVRHFLFRNGFRYRLHIKALSGSPDIVLKKYNTVVFIHGCFWHGHTDCKYFQMPETRKQYWEPKIARNIANDLKHVQSLKAQGWKVIVVWECELRKTKIDETLSRVAATLHVSGAT